MYKIYLLTLSVIALNYCKAQNTPPTVSIGTTNVNEVNKTIVISYQLTDAQNDVCSVWLKYSKDGGQFFDSVPNSALTGNIGDGIMPGSGKTITWNYSSLTGNIYNTLFRLYASDGKAIDIAELVNMVDSNLLRTNLEYISGIRHWSSPGLLNQVRDSIETNFNRNKLTTERQNFTFGNATGVNILGRKAGLKNESKTYIIDAHYDGVQSGPAADDNGSGVVGMLEAARILSKYNFENSLKFIGFDFEESGLIGSLNYNQTGIKPYEQIEGDLNFEMIGYFTNKKNSQTTPSGFNLLFPQAYQTLVADSFRGNFLVVCGNTNSNSLNTAFLNASSLYVPQLKNISVEVPQNGQIAPDFRRSDHATFWDNNKQALMLTDGADTRNKSYHTAGDTIGNLNFTFMSNIVKATIATAATLAKPISAGFAEFDLAVLSNFELHDHEFPAKVEVYPNPNNGNLFLKINSLENTEALVEVFDLKGAIVYTKTINIKKGNETQLLKMKDIKHGNYIVVLSAGNKTLSKSIVVE